MGYTYITSPTIWYKSHPSKSIVPNMCKCPTKPRFLGECLILGGIDCQECGTVRVDKFDRLKYPFFASQTWDSHWKTATGQYPKASGIQIGAILRFHHAQVLWEPILEEPHISGEAVNVCSRHGKHQKKSKRPKLGRNRCIITMANSWSYHYQFQ